MTIKVVHTKVSTIPDGDDTSVVRPSDWNADHTLEGLGTMAEQNANAVAITGGTISGVTIPASNLTGVVDVPHGGTGATTLTGYVKGTGTSALTASSTIPNTDITGLGTASTKDAGVALGVATLDSAGKVPISEIPDAVIGALNYQGTWNASTNTPTLTSSVGTKGYYYVVSVAGTTNLNGVTDWQIGDWAVYNGTAWQKIDNTDSVTSVNGFTGAVVLTTTNVAEGTNLYYTDARSRAALSAGTGISYNSTTGVITSTVVPGTGDVVGPASATDNAIARFDTTTGKLIQNSGVTIDDNANVIGVRSTQYSGAVPATQPVGTMWFDSTTDSLNFQQNAITQQIGEELFIYGKASSAITDSPLQIIYHTGTVGASGVITFAPTVAGITDENAIIGVATEPIALNGFGRVTAYGVVHGINTTGSAFGETWANDDVIWYNPVTGNPTKVKPVAPNIKFQIGLVINAGSGGSGSFQVLLQPGTQLGGTDSNVQLTTPTAAQLLTYSTTDGYWKNTSLAAGTGISVGAASNGVLTVTNSAPDQTVAIASGTGISVTGTYPNFTVTNTSPSSGGTVTSVTATAPVASTGGTTPVISMPAATTSVSGYLTSTDWNTFNNKQPAGTYVTSVSATAPITSTGGTTPTLAMPAATSSVNGYLTSTDWSTFNSKGSGTVTSVAASVPAFLSISGSPITSSGTLAITYSGTALPVANGGSGATTLTGVLKGNGTSAFTAATAGTDYVAPGTATTFTATQTFNGSSSTAAIKALNITETAYVNASAPTSTTNFYINTGAVQYLTSNTSTNWTLNFAFSSGTSLNTAMATGDSISCTLMVTNSTTAYYPSAFTIDGTSVTPKWQGGTAPSAGNASSIDAYTFVIIKTASATYTVLASQTQFK